MVTHPFFKIHTGFHVSLIGMLAALPTGESPSRTIVEFLPIVFALLHLNSVATPGLLE